MSVHDDDFGSAGLAGARPGERWRNMTDRFWYQLVSSLRRPCEQCLKLHGRLSPNPWGQIHPHCECESIPVAPGELAPLPVANPPEVLGRIGAEGLRQLLGEEVAALLSAGLVGYDDLVDGDWRFTSAEDLVRRKGLTRERMTAAGIPPAIAARLAGPPG